MEQLHKIHSQQCLLFRFMHKRKAQIQVLISQQLFPIMTVHLFGKWSKGLINLACYFVMLYFITKPIFNRILHIESKGLIIFDVLTAFHTEVLTYDEQGLSSGDVQNYLMQKYLISVSNWNDSQLLTTTTGFNLSFVKLIENFFCVDYSRFVVAAILNQGDSKLQVVILWLLV